MCYKILTGCGGSVSLLVRPRFTYFVRVIGIPTTRRRFFTNKPLISPLVAWLGARATPCCPPPLRAPDPQHIWCIAVGRNRGPCRLLVPPLLGPARRPPGLGLCSKGSRRGRHHNAERLLGRRAARRPARLGRRHDPPLDSQPVARRGPEAGRGRPRSSPRSRPRPMPELAARGAGPLATPLAAPRGVGLSRRPPLRHGSLGQQRRERSAEQLDTRAY